MKKSTLLHLRFPFSFFLMPIFLLGCGVTGNPIIWRVGLTFFILHFLVYPASNGYNSYFDKDENSIGGLKIPPKVSKELYWVALSLDLLALLLGLFISKLFVVMILIYGLISKAYSHPSVRLKSKPILGWLAAGIFQGYFTVLITAEGITAQSFQVLYDPKVQFAALLSSLMLFGSYPMTQIYQHDEDQKRGDITLSLRLGVLNTFHFTAICFFISTGLFLLFFQHYFGIVAGIYFLIALGPVLVYFLQWYIKSRRDLSKVNYEQTMLLNWISSTCLNLYFIWLIFS